MKHINRRVSLTLRRTKTLRWVTIVASMLLVAFTFTFHAARAAPMGLEDLPRPFVSTEGFMNCSAVVASSAGHGPCGGCHTMDVMGAIMVGAGFGLKTDNGTMEATMDDYVSSYNFTSGTIEMRDLTSNFVVVGGPGVNQVTWYFNNLRNSSGQRALPAYFEKFPNGTDYIYVSSTGKYYAIERDALSRVIADYGLVLMFENNGRHIMILGGLGGSGTWASCKVISEFENWNLNGMAVIVKYSDTNSDGLLDTLSIAENVPGTLNVANILGPAAFGMLLTTAWSKLRLLKSKVLRKRNMSIVFVLLAIVAASQIALVAFSDDPTNDLYTFKEFSHPFVSLDSLLNCSVVVASSVGHGPCGGCHTMDVMGAIMVGAQFGIDALGGTLSSTLDDYMSYYNMGTGELSFYSVTDNLLLVGGPGVNQVTWYYNNLRNGTGARVMAAYFDKFPNGTDYIYIPATDHYYTIEFDGQGRVKTDYGVITLYRDVEHGIWVLIAAGLGGSGTLAASRMLADYRNWGLFGQAAVVKYSDDDQDGFLDTITVPEVVGIGESIDLFWDLECIDPVGSVDWGTLCPGDAKNVTVFIRNEGEGSTVLSLNVSGWLPTEASTYMNIGWNYSGTAVSPGQTVPLLLTLTVDQEVVGVTSFGVNITVSSN